jgi:hypothetical protein
MMTQGISVSKVPGLPVIHVQYLIARDDIEQAHREVAEEAAEILDAAGEKMFRINDFTLIDDQPIFSQVIRAMPLEIRAERGTSSDPRVRTLFVGQSQSVHILIDGLKQKQYGGLSPKLFPTAEAALDYVREKTGIKEA